MNEREQRLAEIRARVEKATPGPWDDCRQDDESGEFWWDIWSGTFGSIAHVAEWARRDERMKFARHDAAFIAHSRDDVPWLLSEIERLSYDGIHTCHENCQRPLCKLRRENEELRGALAVEKQLSEAYYGRGARTEKERDELRAELDEQCRLLGMSGSREAKLMAEVEQLKKQCSTQTDFDSYYAEFVRRGGSRSSGTKAAMRWMWNRMKGDQ